MSSTEINLPLAYQQQMKTMLHDEAEAFLASYCEPRTYGLRVHPLKWTTHEQARERAKQHFKLRPVSWCSDGYYYEPMTRPGRHPYHATGLYYIQEPSAMSAVTLLNPMLGEAVLDLAGAPGGKSTQIASKLNGTGILIANEIHRERSRILAENVERMGFNNVIVTNSDPDTLAERFPAAFDCIMLDAPCSGEGMFRKDHDAIQEWSTDQVGLCANRQWDIIQAAVKMLRPGGRIGYSTCTFNEAENEQMIARWLEQYPSFKLLHMERIWPHKHEGEGHFVAVLRLAGENTQPTTEVCEYEAACLSRPKTVRVSAAKQSGRRQRQAERTCSLHAGEAYEIFKAWADECIPNWQLPKGEPIVFGEDLYWLPAAPKDSSLRMGAAQLHGLRIPRPGLHLAQLRKQRIEPAHALALSLNDASVALYTLNLDSEGSYVQAYLRGNTLQLPTHLASVKGWMLVTLDGLPLGWGKASDGILKNHYPKGLRIQAL